MFTIENNINDVQMFALNISSETDSTNILLLCKDGSYVYTDVNADNGYGLIYMNPSVENDISEGITVWGACIATDPWFFYNNNLLPMISALIYPIQCLHHAAK